MALLAGGDDFGGALVEGNLLGTAGHVQANQRQGVEAAIRQAGVMPVQRGSRYREFRAEAQPPADSSPG